MGLHCYSVYNRLGESRRFLWLDNVKTRQPNNSRYKMFVLAVIKQTVRVPAEKFKRDIDHAISEELNLKFANKVSL